MIRRAVLLAGVALLLAASVALAGGGGLEIRRFVMSGGGGMVESGMYRLHATVGQPAAGPVGDLAPDSALCAGFWCGVGQWQMTAIYLPLVLK